MAEMRDTYRPDRPTSLFTNATKLRDRNLAPFGDVFMKLDAGNEETFERFNRAKGAKFSDLIKDLRDVPVKRRTIQTAVVGGTDGNLTEDNLRDYEERIREINPDELHLYPLLYRPFPEFDLEAISRKELDKLAKRIRKSTSAQVLTFIDPTNMGGEFRF